MKESIGTISISCILNNNILSTLISWFDHCTGTKLQLRRHQFDSWVGKICWWRDRLPTPVLLSFPGSSDGKESACNVGDLGSISGLGRSPGEGKGYPLQYSGLGNFMDCIVHEVAKSQKRLSDLHFTSLGLNKRMSFFLGLKSHDMCNLLLTSSIIENNNRNKIYMLYVWYLNKDNVTKC